MPLVLATRRSPLALAQTREVAARLTARLGEPCEHLEMVTTGDRRTEWSLQEKGGKGLFTKELEEALLDRRADLAVHSAKDLPTELAPGLSVAGYLPRENPADVLVMRESVAVPGLIATSSPRRRAQLLSHFPDAKWTEIRGNVDTRLRKIAEGQADATLLAAAGLNRLGIHSWPGLRFEVLPIDFCVPAAGQAAIALESRAGDTARFQPALCAATAASVDLERRFLTLLGGGCHTAFAVHCDGKQLLAFHESTGRHSAPLPAEGVSESWLKAFADKVLGF